MDFKRDGPLWVPNHDGRFWKPRHGRDRFDRYRRRWRPSMLITLGVGPVDDADFDGTVILVGTTAGRTLVVGVRWGSTTATISSITCTGESNLTLIGSPITNSPLTNRFQLAYLSNITAGGDKTITVTMSAGSGFPFALELTGAETTGAFDSENGANGTTGSDVTTTVTTVAANCAIIAQFTHEGSDAWTAGTGFTLFQLANANFFEASEYDVDVGAAGAKTVNATAGTSGNWSIKAAAFKPSGGAATTRGMPFGHRSTAFLGGRALTGNIR